MKIVVVRVEGSTSENTYETYNTFLVLISVLKFSSWMITTGTSKTGIKFCFQIFVITYIFQKQFSHLNLCAIELSFHCINIVLITLITQY